MIRRLLCIVIWVVGVLGVVQAQNKLFVKRHNGWHNDDGRTWENAKASIREALDIASAGDTIFVSVGVYEERDLVIPAGVTIIGGFDKNLTGTNTSARYEPGVHYTWERDVTTIIDAKNRGRVATVYGRLENCIVRNGYVRGNGAGVYIDGGTVSHCVIIRNRAEGSPEDTERGKGGGAYLVNGGKLINCVLSYNRAAEGLAVSGNGGELVNNTITNNSLPSDCGTVMDVENRIYSTVQLGTQCWINTPLKTTHYPDGTAISPANLYYPNNDMAEAVVLGYLYCGSTFVNSGYPDGPCPTGWHIPTKAEFETLIDFVCSTQQNRSYNLNGDGQFTVAPALASIEGWEDCEGCGYYDPRRGALGNNATGFNATPAGYLNRYLSWDNIEHNNYYEFGRGSIMWTKTLRENDSEGKYYYCKVDNYGSVDATAYTKFSEYFYSIRCLKNN